MGWSTLASSSSDLFIINEIELNSEFSELNQLEKELVNNAITPTIAQKKYPQLLMPENSMGIMEDDQGNWRGLRGLDLHGCMWGLCCFPVGLFTIALNSDEDRITKDSYCIGAGISAGVSIALMIIITLAVN